MGNGKKILETSATMKVVHTAIRYTPDAGGAEAYSEQIVTRTRINPEQIDARVLTTKLRTHSPVTELNPKKLKDDAPYVQRLHHTELPYIAYPLLQALPYYIKQQSPNVIHGYGFWYQPADVAARYAQKTKTPFIFHPIYYENDIRKRLKWQLYKNTIGRKTFAAADVVVVISPFEKSLIEQARFKEKRFELIPPRVSAAEIQTPVPNPFTKRNISGTILFTASRIAPGKGLEDLIQALPDILKHHPDTQLVLAGEDFGEQKSLLLKAKQNGVADHIHFIGHLTRKELIGAYKNADVFIHPSQYEAFGIVVAEAQAAGIPVVARNTSAIPYVAAPENRRNLFTTSEELTGNLLHVLQLSPDQRANNATAAQQYVNNNLNWDRSIKKVTSLYKELVTL